MKLKEITQEITREEYEKYRSMETVDLMRRQIKNDWVPHIMWKGWYGCRIIEEEGHYYIHHMVSKDVELTF